MEQPQDISKKSDKLFAFGILGIVLLLILYNIYNYYAPIMRLRGSELMSIEGTDPIDGTYKKIELTDKLTLVNFWATWCYSCVGELPVLDGASSKLQIIGVMRPPVKKSLLDDFKIQYPNIVGDNAVFEKFAISALPTTIVVRNRRVEDIQLGLVTEEDIKKWLSK